MDKNRESDMILMALSDLHFESLFTVDRNPMYQKSTDLYFFLKVVWSYMQLFSEVNILCFSVYVQPEEKILQQQEIKTNHG